MTHTSYNTFNPRQYLETYYAAIRPENRAMLEFLVNAFRRVNPDALALDFGCGPMLYTALAGAHYVREMHLAEYLPANRVEIQHWLSRKPDSFDWGDTTRTVLELEGKSADSAAIHAHESMVRNRVSHVLACDITRPYPLEDENLTSVYDVIVTSLCVEAVAPDVQTWGQYIAKLGELLKTGGRLILIAVKQSHAYDVGTHTYSVLPLTEADVAQQLAAAGFIQDAAFGHAHADDPVHPYEGLIFATARKG